MSLRVLVAHSCPSVREGLELALAGAGYEVFCAAGGLEARAQAEAAAPELVLWGLPEDARAPGPGAVARQLPDAYLVVLGDGERSALAERAVSRGFADMLVLPFSEPELRVLVHRAARFHRDRRALRLAGRDLERSGAERPIVAASPAMIALLEAVEAAAGHRAPALLRGEPGTGKESLARAIHAQSERRLGPFVAVGCRGPAPRLLEREILAGFIEADGGTLFLDDVDALPAGLQDALLGVLEREEVTPAPGRKPRRVDVRTLAATTRDLDACARAGEVHPDLAARLGEIALAVPALRERAQDIPLLVDHFFARSCRELAKPLRSLSDEALEHLVRHAWPGNVRELSNVLERAVILARGDAVTARELPERLASGDEGHEGDLGLRRARKRLEVEMIRRALRRTGGNRTHAAKLLEISHRALLYKLKEYGI